MPAPELHDYSGHDHRAELIEQGYTIFPDAVPPELVAAALDLEVIFTPRGPLFIYSACTSIWNHE